MKESGRAAGGPAARPAGAKFTAAVAQETQRALPAGPPVAVVPSPDETLRAIKTVKRAILLLGNAAAALLKNDGMIVPDEDAQETAELIVDAYPELALEMGDAKKGLALLAGGSLVVERIGIHSRGAGRRPATPPAVAQRSPQDETGQPLDGLPMQPMSL